jgi:cellulose biosynthesis protein BcsQ
MKKIAVANLKGGVGKTTTSIILADALSAIAGKRVLALDLDSQANLSWALMSPDKLDNHPEAASMTRWLECAACGQHMPLVDALEEVGLQPERSLLPTWWKPQTKPNLRLAVSNTNLRLAEVKFETASHGSSIDTLSDRLNHAVEMLSPNHDFVVMDCSPALGAMTKADLQIADLIVVPTPLNRLCLSSALAFQNVALERHLNITETPLFVVATRVGAAAGKDEAESVRKQLKIAERAGRWRLLSPEFPEKVQYTRALDPPNSGPHQTLKSRYGARQADLKNFLLSLQSHGIISND